MELGRWFKKVDDPILLEFLKVWGRIEVQGQERSRVKEELQINYGKLKRQFSDLIGYLAEVYMAQILLNAQRHSLPGRYFHQENDIEMPIFNYVHLREQLGPGKDTEIDVHGGAGLEQWVAESKWYSDRKVGVERVKKLLKKAELVKKDRQVDFIRSWFFSHSGFTKEATLFMEDKGVLWSTCEDLVRCFIGSGWLETIA